MTTQFNEAELAWHRSITPITEHYCRQIAPKDYHGKRLAYWGHITDNLIHYTAVMLLGIAWMFEDMADDLPPGVQPYPAHLEQEIARLSVQLYQHG